MTSDGKRIALLGGAGGIGRALAARALDEGWVVTVLDLPHSLDRHPVAQGMRALPVDVTDADGLAAAMAQVGPMEGFVNLAGFHTGVTPLEETTAEEFDEVMAGNFRGAYLAARAALPGLRAARGAMVNVVSGLAAHVRPGYGLYGANKAAMVHLTKTLALEAAPEVRVNAVGPAAVDTAFLRGGTGRSDEDAPTSLDVDAYARMTPLGRLAQPADVVGPILFLLGPDSAFMTGQVLWVNGGGYMP
ncbi:SDR family NAD(P)-dependent oxidoreductase [Rhodosalinus halophilus]|nr:SDR family oxidoreductase [Rhodosalinus halophilus]